jgi:hypothetical protein
LSRISARCSVDKYATIWVFAGSGSIGATTPTTPSFAAAFAHFGWRKIVRSAAHHASDEVPALRNASARNADEVIGVYIR